jgi:hypothetical protein
MVNRPSVPEIITVNSEALQTSIRDLLPSQNGFGSELQASNVITPIIDLTATAEGSVLRNDLQSALAFGSQTAFDVTTGTTTLANSPGFYRCAGIANIGASSTSQQSKFELTDGATVKVIFQFSLTGAINFDFVVWLATGESLTCSATNNNFSMNGSIRQIADSEGNLVNPSGFPL